MPVDLVNPVKQVGHNSKLPNYIDKYWVKNYRTILNIDIEKQ